MTNKPVTHAGKKWLLNAVYSEGYCCLNGYLRLCKARGETVKGMAENIGFTKLAIWYHYRELNAGRRPCAGHCDCMDGLIKEIEGEIKMENGK